MKRHKHSLSHYKLLTADMGQLVPIACYEVLPGDTIQQATSLLVRASPLVSPVMHPVSVRVHHFFVPNRIIWDGWEDFITGGHDGMGDGAGAPPVYTGRIYPKSVMEYLGLPPTDDAVTVSALPFLAFRQVFYDWFYDEDVGPSMDAVQPNGGMECPHVMWEKDYFTTSRPWPQRGPDIVVPLAGSAPVRPAQTGAVPTFEDAHGTQTLILQANPDSNANWNKPGGGGGSHVHWQNPNLITDLSQASGANINDFRKAFALQRYQEARARYGSRYTEYLAYLGIRSSDARLQRAEYLGGGKQTISFSEVLQTAPGSGDETGVGTMAGHGVAAMRSNRFRRFFEEHGLVLSFMSVRPKTMYSQGISRMFSRTTKEDYWQRELEQIGQQEINAKELHWNGSGVFGYQDRYSEYKQIPSGVAGEFRSTLNHWHLAREFDSPPAFNESFLTCTPSKRIFQEQTSHSLWVMAYHSIQARRMVRASGSAAII